MRSIWSDTRVFAISTLFFVSWDNVRSFGLSRSARFANRSPKEPRVPSAPIFILSLPTQVPPANEQLCSPSLCPLTNKPFATLFMVRALDCGLFLLCPIFLWSLNWLKLIIELITCFLYLLMPRIVSWIMPEFNSFATIFCR